MPIDPAIAALRNDPAPQRLAAAALARARAAWLEQPACAPLRDQLEAYGRGALLDALPDLQRLLGDRAAAVEVVDGLVAATLPALRAHPLGQVPFRHQLAARHGVLELLRRGRAALALLVYRPGEWPDNPTASFSAGERHELCLHGEGEGRVVTICAADAARAELECRPFRFAPGWRGSFDSAAATRQVRTVRAPLVILRLAREAAEPPPAREYRLEDGQLVHQAAGDRRDSRRELALAVLGSMGHRAALPQIVQAARSGPQHVRWEAVRQALAMDSATGFALLSELADDPQDDLAPPARALRAQLLARYPQLATSGRSAPCPV